MKLTKIISTTAILLFAFLLMTSVSEALDYTQIMKRGVVGENVKVLQEKLQGFGYYTKALDADYGSGTVAAVKQYQASKGLKPDGVVGPKTYAMILADSNERNTKPVVTGGIKPIPTKPIKIEPLPVPPVDEPDDFENCLKFTSRSWNDTDYSRGEISKKIGSWTLKNDCRDHIHLNNLEFEMAIDSINVPYNDIYIELGEGTDQFDMSMDIHNNVIYRRGSLHVIGLENNPFTVEENEEYEISIYADVIGAYSPWNNSGSKTISALAFNEMDFESEDGPSGAEYNFDIREVWSQMVIINH